jgi:hypothetical protein
MRHAVIAAGFLREARAASRAEASARPVEHDLTRADAPAPAAAAKALLAPPATTKPSPPSSLATRPSLLTPTTRPPAKSPKPRIEYPAGSPPGPIGAGMVRDVASELAHCRGGNPGGPIVLVAWGKALDRTWLILAKPPRPGEGWLCWANGLFEAGGAGGFGDRGGPEFPLKPVEATGAGDIRSGGRYWGEVLGPVTKRATRVRVAFRPGTSPLDLVPIQTGPPCQPLVRRLLCWNR